MTEYLTNIMCCLFNVIYIFSQELWLFDTHISGTLPETFSKFTEMEKMYLSNNRLVGTIPDNLQGMQKLDEVDFSNNMLSGSVPLR